MNKLFVLSLSLLCLLFSHQSSNAQNLVPYSTAWAESVGGPINTDRVNVVKARGSKLWVAGNVDGVDFTPDIFVDEYERDGGTYVQRRLFIGGFGDDTLKAMVIDDQGNFYLAGQINQPVDFNPNGTAVTIGQNLNGTVSMAYLAKYDPSFNLQWIDTAYTNDASVQTTALETDGNDVYWAISFADTLFSPGGSILSASNKDALLIRKNSAGGVVWEQYYSSLGGVTGGFEVIEDIVIHPDSNYFVVAGVFNNDLQMPYATSITAVGNRAGFMARYDLANTQQQWSISTPSAVYGGIYSIDIDTAANILYAAMSVDTLGSIDPIGGAVTVLPQYVPNSVYITRYNPVNGILQNFIEYGTPASPTPTIVNDLEVDNDFGLVYVGGNYGPAANLDFGGLNSITNIATSGTAGYISVFFQDGPALTFKDATNFSASGSMANVLDLDVKKQGFVFLGGEFQSPAMEFNPDNAVQGSIILGSNSSSLDGFVLESRILRFAHPDDLAALFELKNATGTWNSALIGTGLEWDTTAVNNDFYNFYGIDTLYEPNSTFYRVKTINLDSLFNDYGVKLTGSLPSTLMNGDKLDYLMFLRLSGNELTAGPSVVWDTMEHLIELNISDNLFTYDAALFVNMTENAPNIDWILADRYLAPAEIAMAHPFPIFPDNGPSGEFYANLRNIDISYCGFSGSLPHPLQFSPVIEGCGFVDNNLTDMTNPGATQIPNLFRIELQNNKFSDISDLAAILNNAPNLNVVWCNNMMDSSMVHSIQTLSIASPTIAQVLLNNNNIEITGGLVLEDMLGSNTEIFDFSHNKTKNFSGPTNIKPALKKLSLAHNGMTEFIEGVDQLNLFINCPGLEELYLSGNYFNGRLPNPLQAGRLFYDLPELRYFDMERGPDTIATLLDNRRVWGELNLSWLLGAQFQAGNPKLEYFNVINQNFKDVKITGLVPFNLSLDSLAVCRLDSNRFEFDDLYRVVQLGRMQQSTNGFYTHYLPAKAEVDGATGLPDTLAFSYSGQKPDGVGGIRRRPENEPIWFDNAIGMPFNLTDTIYNKVYYFRSDTFEHSGLPFAQLPANAEVIGAISTDANGTINIQMNPALAVTPNSVLINPDTSTQFYNIIAITALDSTHSNRYYAAVALNDSFPQTAVYTLPKLLLKGPCIDSLGQPILCQEIIVEFNRTILDASGNPDSLKNLVREELGMYLIDSCTCGDVELWGTSDTAALDLLRLGTGTRNTSSQASTRAELLSASPNYNLLASNNTNSNNYPPLNPIGSSVPSPTLVAIIDAGIDYTHPDLEDRLWINPDEVPNNATDDDGNCVEDDLIGYNFMEKNNTPYDDHGHGTAVAGIIAGRSTNNISANSGSNDSLALIALKYTNANGEGTVFDATCAMYYASNYNSSSATDSSRIRVINASWGYYGEPSPILETAIQDAADNCGALIVTAAGNDGINNDAVAHYPSGFPINNIVSVGAVSSSNLDELASYSNYGSSSVEIAAIGDITTTQAGGGTFADMGTSFSTAQVSRAAGLLFHAYPDASFYAVKYALLKGVDPLLSADSTRLQSGGRLNLSKAMSILDTLTNRSACDNSLFVGISQTEPAQTIWEDANIRIYPNPFNNSVQLEFLSQFGIEEDLEIRLMAVDGTILLAEQLSAGSYRYQLNTEKLAAGLYILNIKGARQQISQKIIKLAD